MKTSVVVLVAVVAAGCRKQARSNGFSASPPQATPSGESAPLASVAPPAQGEPLRGKVTDKFDVARYTYLRLDGQTWAAVPRATVAVGDDVAIVGVAWMENFRSETLGRTWPRIAFGSLENAGRPSRAGMFARAAADAPPAHPSPAAAAEVPPSHPPPAAAADVGEVRVAKAGQRIADLYAKKTQLEGARVSVRGKVVKVTNGVLGKNWLHLRDGTGQGATADLAVASEDTAAVGQTVIVAGTVHLDRDLGAGYHYDVIVEDAKLTVE